jgi:carbon-monoxide dehydrogenase large subunit
MTTTMEPATSGGVIGERVLRKEDPRLLTGQARFTDDLVVPGALWAVLVRSPIAHGRIRSIETSAARAMSGVRAVLTGKGEELKKKEKILKYKKKKR